MNRTEIYISSMGLKKEIISLSSEIIYDLKVLKAKKECGKDHYDIESIYDFIYEQIIENLTKDKFKYLIDHILEESK